MLSKHVPSKEISITAKHNTCRSRKEFLKNRQLSHHGQHFFFLEKIIPGPSLYFSYNMSANNIFVQGGADAQVKYTHTQNYARCVVSPSSFFFLIAKCQCDFKGKRKKSLGRKKSYDLVTNSCYRFLI